MPDTHRRRPARFLPLIVLALLAVAVLGGVLTHTSGGNAAFPGANGRVLFRATGSGNNEIWSMNPDGSDPINLTQDAAEDTSPGASSDGAKVVFSTDRDDQINFQREIYIMDADGSNQTRITHDNFDDVRPALSPDGTKIAFDTDRHEVADDNNYEIYVMDVNGANPQRLTTNTVHDREPVWSPDGTRIAWDGDNDIWVMDANGANQTNLTPGGLEGHYPGWSPDGAKIAFEGVNSGETDIWVMDANGANPTNLTQTDTDNERDPAFSPDGTKIVFTGGDNEMPTVMGANGADRTEVGTIGGAIMFDWAPGISLGLTQGDVDCSGAVNQDDFIFLLRFAAGVTDSATPGACPDLGGALPAGGVPNFWGDVNCDDAVNAVDALYVLAWPDIELPHPGCRDIGQAL